MSPIERVGTYVSPREWNNLISDPDTVLISSLHFYYGLDYIGCDVFLGQFAESIYYCECFYVFRLMLFRDATLV